MSRRVVRVALFALICSFGAAVRAHAQQPVAITGGAGDVLSGALTLLNDVVDVNGRLIAGMMNQLIASELNTFPVASSSAGFAYQFDANLGIPVRSTHSFGSLFADRPFTSGRGHWSFNIDYQQTHWKSIDGINLTNGELFGEFCGGQCYQATEFIDLNTSTWVLGTSVGVGDHLDLGVSVPLATVSVTGSTETGYFNALSPRFFPTRSTTLDGKSSGLGDIIVHGKYQFVSRPAIQAAAVGELRLPSGDSQQLLGAGKIAPRPALLVSAGSTTMGVHGSVGFVFIGSGIQGVLTNNVTFDNSNTLDFNIGGDAALTSRLTVSADLVDHTVFHSVRVSATPACIGCPSPEGIFGAAHFAPATDVLRLGVVGIKVNVLNQWLIEGSLVLPMSNDGLKPGITPVIGFQRAF